jgi:phenylpyruvate tautomerase PptA (4-oxalocrotonate tautomerase family)
MESSDIRAGWSDDQNRAPAEGFSKVVAEVGKVPVESIHIVIREGRGRHDMFGGEPVPEFTPAGGAESDLEKVP